MLQKMQDYMDRSILDEAKKRQDFLNAKSQEQQNPIEQKQEFFNPDPLKLSKLSYDAILAAGWELRSHPSELGNNIAGYEFAVIGSPKDERTRSFSDHVPSYIHFKKVNVDETPNHFLVYVFHDNRAGGKEPIIYPQEMYLKY